jgi:hypothetical protein
VAVATAEEGLPPVAAMFIPSANFAGVKDGYFYSWGERGAGYYRRGD